MRHEEGEHGGEVTLRDPFRCHRIRRLRGRWRDIGPKSETDPSSRVLPVSAPFLSPLAEEKFMIGIPVDALLFFCSSLHHSQFAWA
jgi:hypothetical protein